MALNNNLKNLRKNMGYTQQNIADVLQIPRSTYKNYEDGVAAPDISLLKRISNFYQISIDTLLDNISDRLFGDARVPRTEVQEIFDRLTAHQQKLSIAYMQFFDDSNSETDTIRRVQQGREAQHIGSR